jgi:type IV pilus assembly protein PilE
MIATRPPGSASHAPPTPGPRRERGVTLMELLLVVIIISVMAAISIPSYRSYVRRTQRTDATVTLLKIASQQEEFYLQSDTYAGTAVLSDAPPAGLGIAGTERGLYTVSIPVANALSFRAQAVPAAGSPQADDDLCQIFTVNEQGVRTAADGGGTDTTSQCWK